MDKYNINELKENKELLKEFIENHEKEVLRIIRENQDILEPILFNLLENN